MSLLLLAAVGAGCTGTLYGPVPDTALGFLVTLWAEPCGTNDRVAETTSEFYEFELGGLEPGCYNVDAEWGDPNSPTGCVGDVEGKTPYEVGIGRYEVSWENEDASSMCPD